MTDFNRPKLFDALKYGGECVVCGDEIEAGFPGWVFKGKCACPTHKAESVVDAISSPKDAPEQGKTGEISGEDFAALLGALNLLSVHLGEIRDQLKLLNSMQGGPK